MRDRVLIAALALTQTLLCAVLVLDDESASGRVLLALTSSHGVHVRDLPVVGAWLLGLAICLVLVRSREK